MSVVVTLLSEEDFITNHMDHPNKDPKRWASRYINFPPNARSRVYIFADSADPPENLDTQTVLDEPDIDWYQIDLSQSIIIRDVLPFFEDSECFNTDYELDIEGNLKYDENGNLKPKRHVFPEAAHVSLPYFWFIRGDGVIWEYGFGEWNEEDRDSGSALDDYELNPLIIEIDPTKWDDWEIDPYKPRFEGQNRWKAAPPEGESFLKSMEAYGVTKKYKGMKKLSQTKAAMQEWEIEKQRREELQ